MNRILRKAISLLSEKQRHQIYRKMAFLPAEYFNPDFKVEVAQTQEDLESAYALLHDCYVGIKIIDPQPSGLRCNLFSFLPTSTIIVAKLNGKVVGTVSAIRDSTSGLPSDKEFLQENNQFRRQGKALVEASALAVAPEFRGGHSVSFLLMKYLYNYCRHCFRGDFMVGAVHPRSEDFYKALWQFRKNGKPIQYGSLNGAAAIHISMDLSDDHFKKVIRDFGPENPIKNLGSMIVSDDSRFQYPRERQGLSMHPVITPQMLQYFCLHKESVWSRMNAKDRQTLIQVYTTYFGFESMNDFRRLEPLIAAAQEFRTPTQLSSVVSLSNASSFCEVLDLASGGCYIGWNGPMPEAGEKLQISFRFEGRSYSVHGIVAWLNDNATLRRKRGFGIRFLHRIPTLNLQLQQWVYGAVTSTTSIPFSIAR
jgi:hypothetical protein